MYDIHGNPIGADVLGEMQTTGGMSVIGYEDDGTPIVVGKAAPRGRALVQVQAPKWRSRQLAPGVIATDEGLLPLPMHGTGGTDTFVAAGQRIVFQGQIQKPFHGERLLVSVVRTGASAVGRLLGQIFVGTDLQQADIETIDLEQVGQPGAFGVRLHMKPAQPGVLIRIITTLSNAITGTDTIFASIQLLGKIIH
jgi:hypothetical protein